MTGPGKEDTEHLKFIVTFKMNKLWIETTFVLLENN